MSTDDATNEFSTAGEQPEEEAEKEEEQYRQAAPPPVRTAICCSTCGWVLPDHDPQVTH